MINFQEFAFGLYKQVVSVIGMEVLQQAETNPPKAHTPAFSKVIDILLAFIKAKPAKQEMALRLMAAQPQFATCPVVNQIKQTMHQKDHRLTLEMLERFLQTLADHCEGLILTDPLEGGRMTPEQVGAAHNLINMAELIYSDEKQQPQLMHTLGHLRATMAFRFSEVDKKFLERTDWVENYSPRRDARQASSGVIRANRPPSQQRPPATQHPMQTPPPSAKQPQVAAPKSVFAGKLSDAIVAPLVVSEEPAEVQGQLMEAAFGHLATISPEALDLAKNGVSDAPPVTEVVVASTNLEQAKQEVAADSKPTASNGLPHLPVEMFTAPTAPEHEAAAAVTH